MRIDVPQVESEQSAITVTTSVTTDDERPGSLSLGILEPESSLGAHARVDIGVAPFVPMATVTALVLGEDLMLDGTVSRQQIEGAAAAAALLGGWLELRPPTITGRPIDAPHRARGDGVGLFFTRGIDSWSTLLEHRDRVTHLLFLDSVEPLMSATTRAGMHADNARAAAELGLPVVTLSTNGRVALDPRCSWEYTHGAILASTALLLAPYLGEVLIASSHVSGLERPWGTHADLDHLWSTPELRFRHDGGHLTRWEKTARVARHQPALDSLHVCWAGGARNCGRCHKCLVTMTALASMGALERCARFEEPLEVDAVAALDRRPPGRGNYIVDLLAHLPPGSPLARAWTGVLDPSQIPPAPRDGRAWRPWGRRRGRPR